ncbi:MAG: hypothetical protein ACHQO8_04070, partial [Vicinamibacterales bacterium]
MIVAVAPAEDAARRRAVPDPETDLAQDAASPAPWLTPAMQPLPRNAVAEVPPASPTSTADVLALHAAYGNAAIARALIPAAVEAPSQDTSAVAGRRSGGTTAPIGSDQGLQPAALDAVAERERSGAAGLGVAVVSEPTVGDVPTTTASTTPVSAKPVSAKPVSTKPSSVPGATSPSQESSISEDGIAPAAVLVTTRVEGTSRIAGEKQQRAFETSRAASSPSADIPRGIRAESPGGTGGTRAAAGAAAAVQTSSAE